MSDSLRMELARTQIKVAVIKPAAVKTPIWQKAVKDKDRLLRDMPPEAETYYGYAIDAMVERAQDADKTGASTDVVNRAVWHALTSESPRTRYAVVVNGWIMAFLRLLPDRWRDRLTLGRLGLRES
jgi:short-subunit dehydrogenase